MGVAIEIDGDPSRQDSTSTLARGAVDAGCLFALDSDAHSTAELQYAENRDRPRAARRHSDRAHHQLLAAGAAARVGGDSTPRLSELAKSDCS